MSIEDKYEELYHELLKYEKELHKQNQKRIRVGIKCLVFIPLLFLALVFITDSEKVIFLTLWIVSMFLISAYLIYVEYADFNIQNSISDISNKETAENKVLIGKDVENLESNLVESLKQIEEKKDKTKEMVVQKIENTVETRKEILMALIDKVDAAKKGERDEKEDTDEEHTEDHTK